jgi:hypothetical protein
MPNYSCKYLNIPFKLALTLDIGIERFMAGLLVTAKIERRRSLNATRHQNF